MRKRAVEKVRAMDEKQKQETLNGLLWPCGLSYNGQEDILQSIMYPWQRSFGYCALYDEYMAKFNMILDCEPICFTYDKKQWMVEVWKGQYAFASGAEIGLYVMEEEDVEIPGVFRGPFYRCANDEERIGMKFILMHQGKEMIRREEVHWWLTGFVMGRYSPREDLTMQIELTFPNNEMKNAFLQALMRLGYGQDGIGVRKNTVLFSFTRPKSRQPKRGKVRTILRKRGNRRLCFWYQRITREFFSTVDKTLFLHYYHPILSRILLSLLKNINIGAKIQKQYEQIKSVIK